MYDKPPTSPAPSCYAKIFNGEGVQVARASFGVSPLHDRIYVYEMEVSAGWHKKGYGSAFIAYLQGTYHLPITPIHVLHTAEGFWEKLKRRGRLKGWVITDAMGMADLDEEIKRWAHLEPDIERLKDTISHRLFVLREPYEIAVSRGLDDDNVAPPPSGGP